MNPVIIVVGLVGLGVALGNCGSSEPETKTITKVVEKPVTRVETKTVTVREPLPESCRDALEVLQSVTDSTEDITDATGRALDSLETAHRQAVMREASELVATLDKLRTAQNDLSTAANHQILDAERIKRITEKCNEEVG